MKIIGLVFSASMVIVAGCNLTQEKEGDCLDSTPIDCACIQSKNTASLTDLGDGNPNYLVVSPNGAERYKIGDTLQIVVTSKTKGSATIMLLYYSDQFPGGVASVPVPGTPDYAFDPISECTWTFKIPQQFVNPFNPAAMFSAASDSVKVRIEDYETADFTDVSDGYFQITP